MSSSIKTLAFSGTLILGLFGTACAAEEPPASKNLSQMSQPSTQPEMIKGEILKVQDDVYTIQDPQGEQLRLRIEANALNGKSLKKGDMVQAKIMNGQESYNVISAKKAKQSSSSSQTKNLTGTVQNVEDNTYTIKTEDGQNLELQIEQKVLQGASLKKGDKIQAEVEASGSQPYKTVSAQKAGQSSKDGTFTKTVRGEVQEVNGNVYYIQDQSRKQIRLRLDKSSTTEGEVKKGDMIEAMVTMEKEFHVISAQSASQ